MLGWPHKAHACTGTAFDLGRELFVTASAGIALYPVDGEDADTLIQHADTAMYRAKEIGRTNCQFYKSEMNARSLERVSLETISAELWSAMSLCCTTSQKSVLRRARLPA